MSLEMWENFDDGDTNGWTTYANWNATTDRSYNGSYSGFGYITNAPHIVAERSFTKEVKKVQLYFNETSNSNGTGYHLINSNGDRVVSFGSENPQWMHTNGTSGVQFYNGDGYNRWVRVTVTLDDSTGSASFEFEDTSSGTQKTSTGDYDHSGPVTGIQLVNANTSGELANETTGGSGDYYMHTDAISIEPAAPDTYGTIKIASSGTINELPVYPVGTSSSGVREILRVDTASGVGFIPATDPSKAAFPYLRLQTQNHGVLALHNSSNVTFFEDFSSFDSSIWSLYGTANYDTTNEDVEMISGTNQDGELVYDPGMSSESFTVTWKNKFQSGNYENQYLYFFASDVGTGGDDNKYSGVAHAYVVRGYWGSEVQLMEVSSGSATVLDSANMSESTHTYQLDYQSGRVRIYIDGSLKIDYNLSSPDTSHSKLYFKSLSGINSSTNSIDDVEIKGG